MLSGLVPQCLRLAHGKELPVPKGWNSRLPTWKPQVYHCKEQLVPRGWNSWFPTWEPWATIVRTCRFSKVGTDSSQPGNHRLPLQRISSSYRLELTVANVGTTGYHCKELPVPRGWSSMVPNLGTMCGHCKQMPVPRGGELLVPNPGTIGYHCKELPVPRS